MATAAICLKFTSLAKNRSRCYLEIVPEVTNIKNIDKIQWKDNVDSIEYRIPVTYKIILKKLSDLKENDAVRVYHSCVDLVPSLSWSHEGLAYGDITKNTSDHLIHTNFHKTNASISQSRPINFNIIHEDRQIQSKETNLDKILVKKNAATYINESLFDSKQTESLRINYKNSIGTLTDVLPQQSSYETKTLTIAPVCKIDTFEDLSNSYCIPELETPKPILRYKPTTKCYPKKHADEHRFLCQPPRLNFSFDCNIVPNFVNLNARVSYFKSIMEKEILPLKIILQDIISKCTTFGLLQNTHYSKNNCGNNKFAFENERHCNRVVYSIVFDE